jgi:hypothetical protein
MKLVSHRLIIVFALALASCSGDKDAEIARLKSELASKTQIADKAKPKEPPKLWRDEKIENAIKELGAYDHVYVYRWRQCAVDGWMEVDESSGPKQEPLDQSFQALKKDDKLQAKSCSGELIFALQKEPGAGNTYQLKVSHRFVFDMGSSEVAAKSTRAFKIKMDPNKAGAVSSSAYSDEWGNLSMKRFIGPKEATWLNLKVVE